MKRSGVESEDISGHDHNGYGIANDVGSRLLKGALVMIITSLLL